eukprot:5757817-Pleurochrysis_carterae.AAC.5
MPTERDHWRLSTRKYSHGRRCIVGRRGVLCALECLKEATALSATLVGTHTPRLSVEGGQHKIRSWSKYACSSSKSITNVQASCVLAMGLDKTCTARSIRSAAQQSQLKTVDTKPSAKVGELGSLPAC